MSTSIHVNWDYKLNHTPIEKTLLNLHFVVRNKTECLMNLLIIFKYSILNSE